VTREEMVLAADEIRHLIVLFEQQKGREPRPEPYLKRVLDDREAWLRSEVRILLATARTLPEAHLGIAVKDKLARIEEDARMLSKPEAIAYLRSIKDLNHDPLRRIEQEWLDSIFVRERMSKGWIGYASVSATAEQTGVHVERFEQVPCRCPDSAAHNEGHYD